MGNNKNLVSVGKPKIGGALWRAPKGTTLPTSVSETLGADFACLGYLSTDGLKNSNKKEHEEIKAWGGDTVAMPMKSHTDAFSGTFIESLNTEVLKTVHGDTNVTGTLGTGIAVTVNSADDEEHVYVADMEIKGGYRKRIVIPEGKVTEVGDVEYKDNDVTGYPITITALPDSSENTHYEYIGGATGATGATGSGG